MLSAEILRKRWEDHAEADKNLLSREFSQIKLQHPFAKANNHAGRVEIQVPLVFEFEVDFIIIGDYSYKSSPSPQER